MEFNINTHDIQSLMIGLIFDRDCKEEIRQPLLEKLKKMNNLCSLENNFTLHITVDNMEGGKFEDQ